MMSDKEGRTGRSSGPDISEESEETDDGEAELGSNSADGAMTDEQLAQILSKKRIRLACACHQLGIGFVVSSHKHAVTCKHQSHDQAMH